MPKSFIALWFFIICVNFSSSVYCDVGTYICLGAQKNNAERIGVAANNISNTSVNGFASAKILESSYAHKDVDKINAYGINHSSYLDKAPLEPKYTGRSLDIAVIGGYLKVRNKNGEFYTKNGEMFIDQNEKILVNSSNESFLNQSGDVISINAPGEDIDYESIHINSAGEIYLGSTLIDQLAVVSVPHDLLRHYGGSLYSSTGDSYSEELLGNTDYVIMNRYLNKSNVNTNQELAKVNDIDISNKIVSNIVRIRSDMMRSLTNQIGKN